MLFFSNDYTEGACEQILSRLQETNRVPQPGYGDDAYCASAREKIRKACDCPDADVFFLMGGTQTNAVVLDAFLKPYEGVVSAKTGHISVHEAGAVEHTGHKVLEIPAKEGKIRGGELRRLLETFWEDENHEHMVFPGMVYISHPTEYGTLYTKKELEEISGICREYEIPLYMDGARLGYGLAAETDVTLPVVAACCDVFYIGGTKVGALCGEAVVFSGKKRPKYFMTRMKQHGALLAKGRLLGIQFDALFTDKLYWKLGRHAVLMADLLKKRLREKGYALFVDSPTNQQFVILENRQMERLAEKVAFSFWEKADAAHTVVRFATSWATEEEAVRQLIKLL